MYDRFLHVIDPELAASSSYTGAQILEIMNAKSYAFASESYRYITFAQLHTLDSINGNVSCSYIPGYNTGTIYFYKTSLPPKRVRMAAADGYGKNIYFGRQRDFFSSISLRCVDRRI